MATKRPSWDEFWILLTMLYSSRGTCDRLRTACLLVKDNRLYGAGYNGSVVGLPHCDDAGHLMCDNHCIRTLHAEVNANNNALGDLGGATAYIIATPCVNCVKVLLQRGIRRIVYVGSYDNGPSTRLAEDFCREKSVVFEQMSDNPNELLAILNKVLQRLREPGGIFWKPSEEPPVISCEDCCD